jgi:sigma-B regulation protein RsbU (phosphoserine phosphatase)
VSSPAAVIAALGETGPPFGLLLMDLNYARDTTSGDEGLELVVRVKAIDPHLPVVVMTAWSTVSLAVATMREGVGDFVQKPWDNARLLEIVRAQVSAGRRRRRAQRLEADARDVQSRLLGTPAPRVPGYDISMAWRVAEGLGGDCSHVAALPEGRLAVAIADVCGKGTPAALLMASVKASLEELVAADLAPRALCARLARTLAPRLGPDRFVSLVYAVLDPARGTLVYANAGHPAPVLLRPDGTVRRLKRGGPVLGVVAEADYEEGLLALQRGDRLVLVTDGITEATSRSDAELGDGGLLAGLRETRASAAADVAARVLDLARRFADEPLADDATVVVVDVTTVAQAGGDEG